MNKKIFISKKIITNDKNDSILSDSAVVVENGIITDMLPQTQLPNIKDAELLNYKNLVLIPGFVQTHIHLCQSLFKGLADDLELLDWLQKKIFPYENAHDKNSLRVSAKLGIHELQTSGTTTILDMGTLNYQEEVFEELISSGMRGFSGKCMIDINELYPKFRQSTKENLDTTLELANSFHNSSGGKIKYGFAPRFVLSCSEKLLKDTYEMLNDFDGSLYHTHSSENKSEIETVRKMHGKENIDYFDSIGVLSDRTVLAHGIHVNENETQQLKKSQTRISHCPSSNLKLASGIANIPNFINKGIPVSLGADGAPCNNNLNMFTEMRLAALIHKPIHGPRVMDAKTIFKLATLEGARALHLENQIGSIEIGKKADFVFLNLDESTQPVIDDDDKIYSKIVYSSSKENIVSVYIDGNCIVENGKSTIYDDGEIFSEAKAELKKLLDRI
ncbi:MAG: 5'-deoxyadenosine deaminase [Ignavibacteriales bacterium]